MPVEIVDFRDEAKRDALIASASQSVCILPISVGQDYHKDASWDQTIQLVNRHFAACIIVVVDSLHRFTEEMKLPYQNSQHADEMQANQRRALEMALRSGDEWIAGIESRWRGEGVPDKMKPHIPHFLIPYAITRWDDWLDSPDYPLKKAYIDRMYDLNSKPMSEAECLAEFHAPKLDNFHNVVEGVVITFVDGFYRRIEQDPMPAVEFDVRRAGDLSRQYVLEELAMVEMCRARQIPMNKLPVEVREKITDNAPLNLAYFFGQNSTNKRIFKCFSKFCSESFQLLNLVNVNKQSITKKPHSNSHEFMPTRSPANRSEKPVININPEHRDAHISELSGAERKALPSTEPANIYSVIASHDRELSTSVMQHAAGAGGLFPPTRKSDQVQNLQTKPFTG